VIKLIDEDTKLWSRYANLSWILLSWRLVEEVKAGWRKFQPEFILVENVKYKSHFSLK